MTPEERRERERVRKAAQRANKRNAGLPDATVTPITKRAKSKPKGGTQGGTRGGTSDVPPVPRFEAPEAPVADPPEGIPATNLAAVDLVLASLTIPLSAMPLATRARTLAAGLDDLSRVPQWSGLDARLTEVLAALAKATKAREETKLERMRRAFYRGEAFVDDHEEEASSA